MDAKDIGNRLDQLPQCDIYLTSILGITKNLKNFFPERTLPVVNIPGSGISPLRALIRKSKNIKFPFFAINVASSAENTQSYNSFALRKFGIRGASISNTGNAGQQVALRYHLTPTTLVINIYFLTKDIKDVHQFAMRWLEARKGHYLNFQITGEDNSDSVETPNTDVDSTTGDDTDDAPITIVTELDDTINYPDLEIDEVDSMFSLQTTVTLQTYTGVISKRVTIKSISFDVQALTTSADGQSVTDSENFVTNFLTDPTTTTRL